MVLIVGLILGQLWGATGYWLQKRTKLSSVELSAWLTLAAGLLLPRIFSEGYLYATMCTAISYALMSSSERIAILWEYLLVSGICVLTVFFGQNLLVGIGGRLGTSAAVSVLIFVLLRSLLKRSDQMKFWISVALVVLLVGSWAHAQHLQVVTTFSILEDFVQQVGGDKVVVRSLVPKGADPHSWEPSPREARLVAQADLVVANGAGFDNWLLDLVKSAASPDVPIILVSEGLNILDNHSQHDHGHHHQGDPHLWLSVPNAISYVEKITTALVKLAPEDEQYLSVRSQAYREELAQLDSFMQEQLAQIPIESRVIITYHNAFSYLAERYGFAVVEFLVTNPEAEPNARDLARLAQVLSEQEKPVVFAEPQLSSGTRYVQALAKEVGAQIYTLHSDSLGGDVSSYVEMMKYNTATLVEALQ